MNVMFYVLFSFYLCYLFGNKMLMMMSDVHHRLMPPLWGQGRRGTTTVYVVFTSSGMPRGG